MRVRRRQQREAGFALLVVFLLAAFVAIALYMELPRVVFESQRNREQALIDRGEQYRRAIQLYYRRYARYPPDMKALENTDNRRFLRQRYKDPMTDKDEWRLIHSVGPGIFPDSLVYKAPGQKEQSEGSTTTASTETAPSPWMQRRPSDVTLPSSGTTGTAVEPTLDNPPEPSTMPAGAEPAEQAAEGQQQPVIVPGLVPGQMYPLQPGSAPGQPPVIAPGATAVQPAFPAGFPVPPGPAGVQPGQSGGMSQPPASAGVPGVPGVPAVPGQVPGAANPALDLIRRMLTTPNPRGLQGVPTAPTAQQPTAPMLAGVASNLEAESIKVYNDRSKYNEWEFLYDPRLDRAAMAAAQATQQATQQTAPQSPTQQSPGDGGMTAPTDPGGPAFPGGPSRPGRRGGGMTMPQMPGMPTR
jgi:type II secretory pathway pseudopilin PulG